MTVNTLNLSLIGMGNVGFNFLKIIYNKKTYFKDNFNLKINITSIYERNGALLNENGINLEKVIKNKKNHQNLSIWKEGATPFSNYFKSHTNICVETTPTNPKTGQPGLNHLIEAMQNKMDVITSNKGPIYLEYDKLNQLAKKHDVELQFEATVASCVPILSIKESIEAAEIKSIKAILNGTSNYILSRMTSENIAFDSALKEAQEFGYAEKDPTLDIEGYDAAGKIVILANKILNWSKEINDVKLEGITHINPHAIELAQSDGYVIKQLAIAQDEKLVVEPRLVKINSPLNVSGTLNVIELVTKQAGSIIFMGRGAGGYEAALALVNDLIKIIKKK